MAALYNLGRFMTTKGQIGSLTAAFHASLSLCTVTPEVFPIANLKTYTHTSNAQYAQLTQQVKDSI